MTSPTVSVSALLASKFLRPAPSSRWVTRPHLVQRLATGLDAGRRIALISAPAGYGKSTLAAEWLAQSAYPTAWLSLDASDDRPDRFLTYFVAALRRMEDSFCTELFATLFLLCCSTISHILKASLDGGGQVGAGQHRPLLLAGDVRAGTHSYTLVKKRHWEDPQ